MIHRMLEMMPTFWPLHWYHSSLETDNDEKRVEAMMTLLILVVIDLCRVYFCIIPINDQ